MLSVLLGPPMKLRSLVKDPRVELVTFTGSVAVGNGSPKQPVIRTRP